MGKSTRLRSRVALAVVPLLAAAAVVVTVSWPADAAGTIDTNIENYTLFAQDEINMKGGVVNGGHVGVNSPAGMANICANDLFSMTSGSQFISNTARLTELCKLYNVFVNNVISGAGFTPLTPPMLGFTPPIIPAGIPPVPPNVCFGGVDFTVEKGTSATINPGPYNNIWVKDGAQLTINPGVYSLCGDFNMGRNTKVTTTSGTVVNVGGSMQIGNGSTFGNSPNVKFWIAGSESTTMGKYSHIEGHFIAPNAKILLGDSNDFVGKFWAKHLNADRGVVITGPPTPCP